MISFFGHSSRTLRADASLSRFFAA